jgi:hypothetical protein
MPGILGSCERTLEITWHISHHLPVCDRQLRLRCSLRPELSLGSKYRDSHTQNLSNLSHQGRLARTSVRLERKILPRHSSSLPFEENWRKLGHTGHDHGWHCISFWTVPDEIDNPLHAVASRGDGWVQLMKRKLLENKDQIIDQILDWQNRNHSPISLSCTNLYNFCRCCWAKTSGLCSSKIELFHGLRRV